MKIGLDSTYAYTNNTGIGSYVRNLVEALQKTDSSGNITYFRAAQTLTSLRTNDIARRINSIYRDILWTQLILPYQVNHSATKLLHIPANVSPISLSCPFVITIYDMILFDQPEKMTGWQKIYFRKLLPISARRAQKIITISEYSKNRIVRLLQIPESKIAITYLAASPAFQRITPKKIEEIKIKYGLDKFVFMVGSLEQHKNPQIVFKALSDLRRKGLNIHFIHAGPPGWHKEDIKTQIYELGIQDQVRFLGYVPLDDLVALYNAASLFTFISFYEGFGLPVLEAMACGCPVITSNVTSLPEVTGDAGIMVDPNNTDELEQAIERVFLDPTFAKELSQRGFTHSKDFSWEKCARQTVEIYQEALDLGN